MTKRVTTMVAVIAAMLLGLSMLTAASAGDKVDVCHLNDDGGFHLINISENAFAKHVEHGDATPGDAVPGVAGYIFDDDCAPITDSASGDLVVTWVGSTGNLNTAVMQFDSAAGTLYWETTTGNTFTADLTIDYVNGDEAKLSGMVTSSQSGASVDDTFWFRATDGSDQIEWQWTGPGLTNGATFTITGGAVVVDDVA